MGLAEKRRCLEPVLTTPLSCGKPGHPPSHRLGAVTGSCHCDSTADGTRVVDRHGRFATFNRQFVTMWRIPKAIIDARCERQRAGERCEEMDVPTCDPR